MDIDKREDSGEFYPGGEVIPVQPITPGGGGEVVVDDVVTSNSPNPVKSSGIWSALWGKVATTYASVSDWVTAIFVKKSDVVAPSEDATEGQAADAKETYEQIDKRVEKETGKGLSTNDYTTEDKTKLGRIEAGAQKNPDLSGYALKSQVWQVGADGTVNTGKGFTLVNRGLGYKSKMSADSPLTLSREQSPFTKSLIFYWSGTSAPYLEIYFNDEDNGITRCMYIHPDKIEADHDSAVLSVRDTGSATLLDIINTANGENTAYVPRYPFTTASVADGAVTLTPYAVSQLTSDGTAFKVAMGGEGTYLRDCVFVVTASDTAPTISWGVVGGAQKFSPRTDAATDMEIAAGVTKVFWVTEYAPDQFAVAGWQVTAGGNAEEVAG